MIGVNAIAQPISAWSSTGISITSPRTRSGARTAASSATFAPSEVPSSTAPSAPSSSSSAITCAPKAGIE